MILKKMLCATCIIASLFCSCSTGSPGSNAINHTNHSDEAEIKANVEAYVDAFNRKDPTKIASFWAEDAVFYNPLTGEEYEGRDEIQAHYKTKFETEKNHQLKITLDKIDFPESDEAKVKSHFQILDGRDVVSSGRLQIEHVKEDGKWYILKLSEFEKLPISTQYEKLKDFDWVVGRWVDESNTDDIEINNEWKWDKHKNFLTERFSIKMFGEDDFEGFQILGWDPAKEKVRIWVFDSDGGFGEGTLNDNDGSWYVSMVFTQPDGSIGTATNIYKKEDGNSYTFSSIDRDVEGHMLPNVGPFKMIRK